MRDENNEILVSICCITYNHEPYIRDAIEGFLMQKTDFPFEVLIHDDASTDGTADIIREYETKYPDIIKPIYQTENQYSKGIKISATYNYPRAKGKYIALCEGDDYWIDPYKLQKQVDFLEAHEECVLTCHRYKIFNHENNIWSDDNLDKLFIKSQDGFFFDYSLNLKTWLTKTLTMVFRTNALDKFLKYAGKTRDTVLVYFLMKKGIGYCFNDIMGVYRLNNGGVCGKQPLNKKIHDAYFVLKDLYLYDKNKITKKMYFDKYFSMFFISKGNILFKEKFEIDKFISLFYFSIIKAGRFIKRLF